MSLHTLQQNNKINNEIPSTRHDNLLKHVHTKNWNIKKPQTRVHHPRVPESRFKKMRMKFGAYSQSYIFTTESTKQRTVGAIALIPENERGGYYFMSIDTRKQIHAFI